MCHHVFMYDIRDKNTNSQTNGTIITTETRVFAECRGLCRVSDHGHSVKKWNTACPGFAECRASANNGTRQRVTFAECWSGGTRQSPRTCPARAPAVRRPSVGLMALSLYRVPPPGTRQSSLFAACLELALGKGETLPSALAWLSA